MKVIFEFDTESEDFNQAVLECYYQAERSAQCLNKITDKLRSWEKYDERTEIPTDEIHEKIWNIIEENVSLERMLY